MGTICGFPTLYNYTILLAFHLKMWPLKHYYPHHQIPLLQVKPHNGRGLHLISVSLAITHYRDPIEKPQPTTTSTESESAAATEPSPWYKKGEKLLLVLFLLLGDHDRDSPPRHG